MCKIRILKNIGMYEDKIIFKRFEEIKAKKTIIHETNGYEVTEESFRKGYFISEIYCEEIK